MTFATGGWYMCSWQTAVSLFAKRDFTPEREQNMSPTLRFDSLASTPVFPGYPSQGKASSNLSRGEDGRLSAPDAGAQSWPDDCQGQSCSVVSWTAVCGSVSLSRKTSLASAGTSKHSPSEDEGKAAL